MRNKTVVLAYSGGLDTSCILKWLKLKGYTVIAYVANVGQEEDFDQVVRNAEVTGADKVIVADLRKEFITDYIFPAFASNALYEGRYLLGTAIARPVIAKHQVRIAEEEGADWVSHGATGKGNDQVRFEFAYAALNPNLGIISPWKDPEFLAQFEGRPDLIRYAKEQNIDIPVTLEKPFSTDENLLHKSYESGVLEDPMHRPDPDMYTLTTDPRQAPDQETLVEIEFADARPVRAKNLTTGEESSEPLALFDMLNTVARTNGIGRIDIVENRFIGIKSRGVYETPGGTLLHTALRDLEGIAMDPEVQRLRDMLAPKLAQIIYNGFWFGPEMDFLLAGMHKAQEMVSGTVILQLYKGNCLPVGRNSPSSLYDRDLASMDIEGQFDQTDSKGFIRIHSIRLKAHRVISRKQNEG